jgi:anti-anti-sigma regulatory factor
MTASFDGFARSAECGFRAAQAVVNNRENTGCLAEDAVYTDKQLVIAHEFMPAWLRFSGELDAWNVDAVVETLVRRVPNSDLHFELTQLSFTDVTGIRALAAVAWNLRPGYRLILHGVAPQLRIVLNLVGWAQVTNLGLCECGGRA